MTLRPTIFISAVSKELHSARQLVANSLTFLGYEPVWQDTFAAEGGELRKLLRQKIDQCQGVLQIVGQCYGAESPAPDKEFGRVSFTQYEALCARKRGKKVWYFLMEESFPVDAHESEPEALRQLQTLYRNTLQTDTHLFHPLASYEALEASVLKLRDDLSKLRRAAMRSTLGLAVLLSLITLLVLWLVRGQRETTTWAASMSAQLAREGDAVEIIARRFESIASTGGLILSAKTPEEHYHNARVHELGGNFLAARKEYTEYLSANLEALDPWLSYSAMLKATEGKAGAIETMRQLGKTLAPHTVSYQTAVALLEDGEARSNELLALAAKFPDYGPLAWLVSQDFSEAIRGDSTLADQRAEKDWLEKFRTAQAVGNVQKYFVDKKEAQKWTDAADTRWVKLSSMPQGFLENPVTLTAHRSNAGWMVSLMLTDSKAKELFYTLDGEGDFRSTGHLPLRNVQTGLPMVNPYLPLPNLSPGEHTITVKYIDKNEKSNGPYALSFSTEREELAQGKMALQISPSSWVWFGDYDDKVLLWFSHLVYYRPIIREIRFSLDSDKLDQTFAFMPTTKYEIENDVTLFLEVSKHSQFANVQITYRDGTISPIQKILRTK